MEQVTAGSLELEYEGYAPPGEDKPLGAYALLAAAFNAGFAGALFARRRDLPERVSAGDLALLTVGTHKLSRLIAKDKVTSPLRAPFVRYEEDAGPSEVSETPRGSGLRKAIGELISCPFCIGQWVAAAALFGLLVAPRTTRFVASLFAIMTGSDFLQLAYKAAQDKGL
jgi:Protein of unknown function (DUF1360)